MYGFLYLMHHKFEAFEKFKECQAKAEKQLGKYIKAIQFD